MHNGSSVYVYDTGNPKAVLSDNLEGWDGREVGGGSGGNGLMYTQC